MVVGFAEFAAGESFSAGCQPENRMGGFASASKRHRAIEERFWRKKEAVEGGGPQNNSSTANIAVDISTAAWKVRSSMDAVAANTAKRCVADRPLQFCARCVCAIHFSKRQIEMRGPRAWRNIGPLYGGGYIRPRSVTRAALLVFALTTFWPGCGIWQTAFEEQPPYC